LDQTVPGHFEVGLFDANMIETEDGNLFLIGGQDGYTAYKNIYAYHELFGFYDTGFNLPYGLYSMTSVLIK
jgi:hypothetical protein